MTACSLKENGSPAGSGQDRAESFPWGIGIVLLLGGVCVYLGCDDQQPCWFGKALVE